MFAASRRKSPHTPREIPSHTVLHIPIRFTGCPLAVSLINTIEYNLGERLDLDAPGRRRIARAWGVVYINDDGSVNEESIPVTPPPAS